MPQPSSVKRRKTPTRTPTVTRPRLLILGRGLLRMTTLLAPHFSRAGVSHYGICHAAEHGLGVPPPVKVLRAVSASSTVATSAIGRPETAFFSASAQLSLGTRNS